MASPSVTYTFKNGETADATEINQNFSDLINSLTDSTKDLSISALTCAGAASLNGNVTLGNASGDDLVVSASLASHIVPKTDDTYDLGSSSIGYRLLYLGGNSNRVGLQASSSTSSTYNLTLPVATGAAGEGMLTDGSGILSWKPIAVDTSAKSASYVITDGDGLRTILVTTGASDYDVTLPTASANTHRIITVKKVDSGAGIVTVKSDAAGETIDGVSGTTGIVMAKQYNYITVQCDGSDWFIVSKAVENTFLIYAPTGHGSTGVRARTWTSGNAVTVGNAITYTSDAVNADYWTINQTGLYHIQWTDQRTGGIDDLFISKNTAATTTGTSIAPADSLGHSQVAVSGNYSECVAIAYLVAGDVIRCHDTGSLTDVGNRSYFRMSKIN